MWEILILYYFWILPALYLWWVLHFCTYHTKTKSDWRRSYKAGEKKTFPLWVVALTFLGCFIPGVVFIIIIAMIIRINDLHDEQDTETRSFLFKKV